MIAARRLAFLLRHMECFRRPRKGGLAAVGDSITVGAGEPRYGFLAADSWVSYVVGTGRVPYGYNAAVSGQTTEQLVRGLPAVLARRPQVVVVASGTNDAYPLTTIDLIREAVEQIRRAGAEPVLATIPPFPPRNLDIGVLNEGLRNLAEQLAIRLIDFNAVLSDGDDFKAGLSDDGRHPNARGSKLMAQVAQPALVEVFSRHGGRP